MANKSKRFRMRANKSRKNKRGGKKNHSLLTTQMAGSKLAYNTLLSQYGGQVGSAPAPAPSPSSGYPFNLGNIEPTSLATALQQFGDAVQSFAYTADSTSAAATAAEQAVAAQRVASNNLTSAVTALKNTYFGGSWTNDQGVQQKPTGVTNDGLFKIIKGDTFTATQAPNPVPNPAPAPN